MNRQPIHDNQRVATAVADSATEIADNPQNGQLQFTCRQCGASTAYQVGTKQLTCTACGHSEAIEEHTTTVNEYPLNQALKQLKIRPLQTPSTTVSCDVCGAESTWDVSSLSDLCPYCRTPIAKLDTLNNRLQVEAIVPFSVEKSVAYKQFSAWLKKRWFAPNLLKEMAGYSKQFEGVYLPHWTFDSLTYTDYQGQRGEYYIDYVRQTRVVNGKTETVDVPVTKVRWYPAAGQVRVMFDDVLVLASMLIPKTILNRLRPWQLQQAQPYTPEYVAGLKAKYYQIDLDEAFNVARQRMAADIDVAIRRDIGGDQQQIHRKNTRYQNSTYKLILLPVWYSNFEYKGKTYQTVINGQNGKVAGQYPKSPVKIIAAVIAAILVLGVIGYFYYQLNYAPY